MVPSRSACSSPLLSQLDLKVSLVKHHERNAAILGVRIPILTNHLFSRQVGWVLSFSRLSPASHGTREMG